MTVHTVIQATADMPVRGTPAASVSVAAVMADIGRRARAAQRQVRLASDAVRAQALREASARIRQASAMLLDVNAGEIAVAIASGQNAAFIDRLRLDAARVDAIADAVASIAALPDPVGQVLASYERPNGLLIERVATPLGVVAVIFESRPNVTADAAALCVRSGNAVILRAGSDSFASATVLADCMRAGLVAAGLPADAVQLAPTRDREAVGAILSGLDGCVDVVVPRGGRGLVERVQQDARVPVFAHLDGNCHVYVHAAAELGMAKAIVFNAKLRRTGVCGSAETLLVDRGVAGSHLQPLVAMLLDAGCAVRGDHATMAIDARVTAAVDADWATEYLDAIIAVRVVDGLDAAIDHIERYGSHHTDAIVSDDAAAAARFLSEVDSAIVLHNASTQFADGGEFGFGAEIGIATGRMHARGPVGVAQLCSYNYRVRGVGQIRP